MLPVLLPHSHVSVFSRRVKWGSKKIIDKQGEEEVAGRLYLGFFFLFAKGLKKKIQVPAETNDVNFS